MAQQRNWRRNDRRRKMASMVEKNQNIVRITTPKQKPVSRKLNIDEVRRRLLERKSK